METMGLDRRHLLLLFIAGLVSRGFVKSLLGANASVALLLAVAAYYLYMKRHSESIYDEIARTQAEAAAKLDAIHGIGDGKVTAAMLATRTTQFKLNPSEQMIITDRIRQHSSKMSGTHKDRKKFLRKRVKHELLSTTDGASPADTNSTAAAVGDLPPTSRRSSRRSKQQVERVVEDAVNDTI